MNKPNAKDYVTDKQIELAKNSEYGGVAYTEMGPVAITKDGEIGWYGRELPQYKLKGYQDDNQNDNQVDR